MGLLLSNWGPYCGIAALAGLVNAINAWAQLAYDCRYYVFFRPHRLLGVYVWALVQLAFPAVLVWYLYGFSNRPTLGPKLVVYSLLVGAGFVALLNTKTQIAGREINLRVVYDSMLALAYGLIARAETGRNALFRQQLATQLQGAMSSDLENGFDYLRRYVEVDVSLGPDQKQDLLREIEDARSLPLQSEQAAKALSLLQVRRRDLPIALEQFGCDRKLIGSLLSPEAMSDPQIPI